MRLRSGPWLSLLPAKERFANRRALPARLAARAFFVKPAHRGQREKSRGGDGGPAWCATPRGEFQAAEDFPCGTARLARRAFLEALRTLWLQRAAAAQRRQSECPLRLHEFAWVAEFQRTSSPCAQESRTRRAQRANGLRVEKEFPAGRHVRRLDEIRGGELRGVAGGVAGERAPIPLPQWTGGTLGR